MGQIYLANAAFKAAGYDLGATVKAAAREGFAGVQLYVNEIDQDDLPAMRRLADVARAAHDASLGVIVHLPRVVTEAIAEATRVLLRFESSPRAIAHYEPGRPVPEIEGVQVGLENAIQGLDPQYYEQLIAEWNARATFLAFDPPRLFGRRRVDLASAYSFAEQMLDELRPDDVLHLIDQRRPGGRRADWCVLGRGLLAPLLPRLAAHPGLIVLEFETLGQSVASKAVLEAPLA